MYIVTYYSYRGGVGRTMALANTAAELAKRGRKVLIVDFDLEAPGISTFDFCKPNLTGKGIVDYICEYREGLQAPAINDFVHRCEIKTPDSLVEFWIMPAGRQDEHYAEKFHSINWEELYSKQSGFLMMENLKEQWNDFLRPDYVFIDSRTGHTDISGICTRQLPDAVAFIFFPNLQNLAGLSQVVNEARSEALGDRKKLIQMHFVASNVPDIDDEAGILYGHLKKFESALSYSDLNVIRYYNSLSIVNQDIFTLLKPKTKLAKEYVKLANNLIRHNPADRDGALAYLSDLREKVRANRRTVRGNQEIRDQIAQIKDCHPNDGQVHGQLGDIYFQLGDFVQATTEYEEAIKANNETAEILFFLSFIYAFRDRREDAADCLLKIAAKPSTDRDIQLVIEQLIDVDATAIPKALDSEGVKKLAAVDKHTLSKTLRSTYDLLPYAMDFLTEIINSPETEEKTKDSAKYDLVLCKIASGKFDEALHDLGAREAILGSEKIPSVFNYGMVEWAIMGNPSQDIFQRVVDLSKEDSEDYFGANYCQCLAIANFLLGDRASAYDWLSRANQRVSHQHNRNYEFSCWSYLNVTIPQFISDLENIRHMFAGENVLPLFMTRELTSIH